ncbi:cation-transporting P-type ATPase [Lacisediminimonas sp.]|uniref:cation-transporting P-type ATPase n=1 Tax=Lacisediminimonas sp. TaxID=3060582 RepID=UPI00271873BA|nr:cation-transporting P-type ATPase [Lacisediminimonas sp.]MDO8300456.1 cation-transporting P-type ATPase [Lacisediminimonas sp.]
MSTQSSPPPPPASSDPNWHALSIDEVAALLRTHTDQGLSAAEAAHRLQQSGPNTLPQQKRPGPLRRFLAQFHNILIYILLLAGLITALLGHVVDSAVIVVVVLVNAVIGFIQEGKAEDALAAIRKMLSSRATVLRDARQFDIPADELVAGDLVLLASGDKVPADLRLIQAPGLQIDEAILTGESLTADKQIDAVAATSGLGDRFSMAYSGTVVTHGRALGCVVATGARTEIGRIGRVVGNIQEVPTPLLRKMATFGQVLTWSIVGAGILLFAFGVLVHGYPARDMFMAVVGLAVAAIPEGLPAIVTIALAIGVKRMARRNAIVRRLPAVEALGSVTVICTDKTGTLTRNEMTAQQVLTADTSLQVTGAGYEPKGEFLRDGRMAGPDEIALLDLVCRAALLCNDASLREEGASWRVTGDPTEIALLTLAVKAGLEQDDERRSHPRDDVIPFESEHRFMATLHHDHQGRSTTFLKGAPERVLALCSTQAVAGGTAALVSGQWQARLDQTAAAGMRLLAIAMRTESDHQRELLFADVERGGFTLLAVLGLSDPPREEAIRSIAACRKAGIRVKMITGDHPVTATAIGQQLGLADDIRSLRGEDLDAMSDSELRQAAVSTAIFARASPEHKLRLVRALQDQGEVVAMTGDGVNDSPALKSADVGVAMGGKGTEAAKDSAEIVLADDNFASIVAAVEEGRTVYDNIRKAIIFILPTNGGEAGMVVLAILLGMTLPITPVQILWVNMVTEITLSLSIAFEKPEANVMSRPPRDPREPLLSAFLLWRIAFVSVLLMAGCTGLFLWEIDQGESLEFARSVAINALVTAEMLYLLNCRHLHQSWFSREGVFGNPYVLLAIGVLVVLQLIFTYHPQMQALFGTAAIDWAAWGRIMLFAMLLSLVLEAEKLIMRRWALRAVSAARTQPA